MELAQAMDMLRGDHIAQHQKQEWADLGCGTGTFTLALAGLLSPKSLIHAMDTNPNALDQVPANYNSVTIDKLKGDFERQSLPFDGLNGILMANSLHYVKDKSAFIKKAIQCLGKAGGFLLVEYDTKQANQWVPYPLDFSMLQQLFQKEGFGTVKKLEERPSLFRSAKLYSVYIKR